MQAMASLERTPTATLRETYPVVCHACRAPFDALSAVWCSCLVTERTLSCPQCRACFCKAPTQYKQRFWSAAPKCLWDAKWHEHHAAFTLPENPEPGAVTRPLVLAVDDEPSIQRVAHRVVTGLGYSMILARNGEEGLEHPRRYAPELVLSDALMPKLDGREMCRRIKSDPSTAHAKVVLMTALYTSYRYHTQAFKEYRADEYLAKPLDVPSLREVLRKHLG
jgi:CheY-like chemotaxis protein